MDRSYAFLLLFVRLKQVNSSESVLRIFSGAVSELWPGFVAEVGELGREDSVERGSDSGGEARFPLAGRTRRHGELVVRSPSGTPLTAEDRALLFNAVELLQLFLENIDQEREAEELKSVLEEAARRRGIANLRFARELLSQVGGAVSPSQISVRLGWAEEAEDILLESSQTGMTITAAEIESLSRELCLRTMSLLPKWDAVFATVESGTVAVSCIAGWSTAFMVRETLEGLNRTLLEDPEGAGVSLSVTSYGDVVAFSLVLTHAETQGSPRNLDEGSRKLLGFYARRGNLSLEESWEWGFTRFTLKMERA